MKLVEQNEKIIAENDKLRADNDKMSTELGMLKKLPATYTQEQMDEVKASHERQIKALNYDYDSMVKEYDEKTSTIENQLKLEESNHRETSAILKEYTKALQMLADDMGVKDIAILIINNIKTFEQFKKDFIETTKDRLDAKAEKDFQKKMTEFTKGNMEFVNGIVSKGMSRAAALPGATVVG